MSAENENRVMTMEQAREVLIDIIEGILNACDEVRVLTAPPNPESWWSNLFANMSTFFDPPPEMINSGGLDDMVEKETERKRSRMPEDWDDWQNRGWLDEDDNRSVSSICGVNPHCYTGLAMACSICYADAIDEMFQACWQKNNNKPSHSGKVRTRRSKHVPDPFRGVGRPKKPPLVGPPAPPKKKGRPRKFTDAQRKRIKQLQNAVNHQRRKAGQPPANNGINKKWGIYAGNPDRMPPSHQGKKRLKR